MASRLRSEIDVLRSAVAYNKGDYKRAQQLGLAAIAGLRPQTGYIMGLAYFHYIGALRACGQTEQAIASTHQELDASDWQPNLLNLRLLLALVNVHYEMADLAPLRDILPRWQRMAQQCGMLLSLAWSQYGVGWLRYQGNDLDGADEAFRELAEMSWGAHGRAFVDGYTGLVLTALAQGRHDDALTYVGILNQHLLERGMLAFVGVAQSLAQRVAVASGSPATLDWRPDPGSLSVSVDLWEQPALTQVRTLLAVDDPHGLVRAAQTLEEGRAQALARNSQRKLIEIGGLQALVLAAQGHEAAALASLREAVERAASGGVVRMLADCGPGLVPLLSKLEAAGVAPAYVGAVIAACGPPPAAAARPDPAPDPGLPLARGGAAQPDALTNREIDILVLLAERLSDKEIAERLFLSPMTVKKHEQRIYQKLDVHSRRAAVIEARRLGII